MQSRAHFLQDSQATQALWVSSKATATDGSFASLSTLNAGNHENGRGVNTEADERPA